MKKLLLFLLTALLCLSLFGCGKQPADQTPAGTDAEQTDGERIRLPDFTVETVDGGTFSLSEALAEKQIAVINLWATWCGYCTMEFPYLEEAYAQYRDQIAIVCLSVEPQDTPEAIRAYMEENGFSLPMGSALGTGLESYAYNGVPVTIVTNQNAEILSVELGAKSSAAAFAAMFNGVLNDEAASADACEYTVYFATTEGELLPGCAVSFCAGETCVPVFADDTGVAVYSGAPHGYTVKLISVPEGYKAADAEEQEAGPYSQSLTFYLQKETP